MLVGFGLLIWAGVSNYHVRRNEKIAAVTPPGQQLVLTPEGGTATAAPDAKAEQGGPPNPLLGKPAPVFELADTAGNKVSLASYKGRPVLINFWATWCGPCRYEIPWIASLRTKYAGQGFEVLGVSSDEIGTGAKEAKNKAAVAAAAQKFHINYPVLLGGDAISQQYGGVDLLPQSFYVDRTGKVVAVITGAGSEAVAEADVKKAIGSGV